MRSHVSNNMNQQQHYTQQQQQQQPLIANNVVGQASSFPARTTQQQTQHQSPPNHHCHHLHHQHQQPHHQQTAQISPPPPSSPTAAVVRHTLDSTSALQHTLDRRKTFRCRGSLGPTVASAPSVEHEDYRTPKPSVCSIGMAGKSFDFGGAEREDATSGSYCSDSNGLIKVSADFLRLNGSRQQFRSLLSRKKLGQLPPAYTQIDCSYESFDSNQTAGNSCPPSAAAGSSGRPSAVHPLIKVEDAGSESRANSTESAGTKPAAAKFTGASSAVILIDSQYSSLDKQQQQHHVMATNNEKNGSGSTTENGGSPQHVLLVCSGFHQSPTMSGGNAADSSMSSLHPSSCFKRNGSRYGAPIDGSAVKMVYKIRSQRLADRVRITDRCLILAMLGIFLMIIDTELCGQNIFGIYKEHAISLLLRSLVVLSTFALLIQIVHFYVNEIKLDLVDCGADDWRVVLTWRRTWHFLTEFLLCSIIPFPGTGTIHWSFIQPPRTLNREHQRNGMFFQVQEVPLDIVLSLLMLSRVYLVGRWQVLHSKQFQDASTRTLAALNRIQVNFAFVIKTILDQRPMLFLSFFLIIFWITTAWLFAQCERFGREEDPFLLYSNALWFIAITFNGNGYGDIIPSTLAGRLIAILVGISGAVISSILIAVISHKILLSQGQKNVNNFMNDSRLTLSHKHAAARVLQKTWHIYRCLKSNDTPDYLLRKHQRKFLNAIYQFRRIKNKIRAFGENSTTSLHQLNRLMLEMHAHTQKLAFAQEEMRIQMEALQHTILLQFPKQSEPDQK